MVQDIVAFVKGRGVKAAAVLVAQLLLLGTVWGGLGRFGKSMVNGSEFYRADAGVRRIVGGEVLREEAWYLEGGVVVAVETVTEDCPLSTRQFP